MNKYATLSILLIIFLVNPSLVSAHTLKSSGSIGAVMHIQPEDDPIVREESSFYFEFKDQKHLFSPQNCDCTFFILQNGAEIFSQPLFQNHTDPNLTHASVQYTFPQKGVYTVKVVGNSLTDGGFDPFTLEYDIRVERTTQGNIEENSNWISDKLPIIMGGVLGISAIAVFIFLSRKNEKHP